MPWIQKVTPPKNPTYEFTIEDFSGGLNNRSSIVNDNEATNLLNLRFTYQDILEKRNGFKKFDDLQLSDPITYLDLYRPYNDDDVLIRATDREVYANDTKICDVNGRIDGVNHQGMFLFCDGSDLYAYGKFPSQTSTYLKIIGNIPSENTLLKVTNPKEGYTPLDEVHTRGVLVINYDEGTISYEPCVNELDDPYLGVNLLPENPTFIQTHKGRIFISGDDKDDDNVYMSDLKSPFYFAVALPIQLPPNSDKVRGLYVFFDSVIVGREFDIYVITGETNNPELGFPLFTLNKINTHTGVANNKSMDASNNYLFYVGSDGVCYALSTISTYGEQLATQIISNQIDIFKAPINATEDDLRDASTCYDRDNWYVNIGDKTLVYSYRHRAWTLYDKVDMYSPLRYFDKLIWGRHDGLVCEWSDDYMDLEEPIYAFWESKNYDMGSATRYKQFREFFMVAHAYDYSDSDVRVHFETDYSDVNNSTVVENKISYYGIAHYGDRFINRNISASIPFMIGRRARYLKIRFANGFPIDEYVETELDLYDIMHKYNYMGAHVAETNAFYYYEQGQWIKLTPEQLNQPMRVYKINGEYNLKGKR